MGKPCINKLHFDWLQVVEMASSHTPFYLHFCKYLCKFDRTRNRRERKKREGGEGEKGEGEGGEEEGGRGRERGEGGEGGGRGGRGNRQINKDFVYVFRSQSRCADKRSYLAPSAVG